MEWDKEALKELEKVPEFVRDMAKNKVENVVKEKGGGRCISERCPGSF